MATSRAFEITVVVPDWPKPAQDAFVRDLFSFMNAWRQPDPKLALVPPAICDGCGKTIAEHGPLANCRPVQVPLADLITLDDAGIGRHPHDTAGR